MVRIMLSSAVLLGVVAGLAWIDDGGTTCIARDLRTDEQVQMVGGCHTVCRRQLSTCWEIPYCGTDDSRCSGGSWVCHDTEPTYICSSDLLGPGPTCVWDSSVACGGSRSLLLSECGQPGDTGYCKYEGDGSSCSDLEATKCHEE